MKSLIFLAFLLGVGCLTTHAQRQLAGQKGVELAVGLIPADNPLRDFFYGRVGITNNRSKGNYQYAGVEYRHKKHVFEETAIPVESYTAEIGYSLYLIGDWRRTFVLNVGLGAVCGYEVINKGERRLASGALIISKDHFLYGGSMNLSLESYLGDKVVFFLRGQASYLLGTSVEHLRPGTGIGLRFIF